MTILKLQKDSPESGEHFKFLQSMSEVSRKAFQTDFQESYFLEKAFFLIRVWPIYVSKRMPFQGNTISENHSK